MNQVALLQWLEQSFSDQRLDNDEKSELRQLAGEVSPEHRRFLRNRAFDLVRDALADNRLEGLDGLRWLEQVIRTLDASEVEPAMSEAHFSPGNACRGAIQDRLHQARQSVDICVFTLSDDRISEAVLKTHQRGIAVRIISDNDKINDEGSDVAFLQRQGVPVRIDRSPYHMHHKFALFDQHVLLNGSFNWTRSASDQNEENIVLTSDPALVKTFAARFESLWERFG